jgi:hypothetical protein
MTKITAIVNFKGYQFRKNDFIFLLNEFQIMNFKGCNIIENIS